MKTVPISGRLLQLRCAACNQVQEPSSPEVIELFARTHRFHSGYTLLVEIAEPLELSWDVAAIQTKIC